MGRRRGRQHRLIPIKPLVEVVSDHGKLDADVEMLNVTAGHKLDELKDVEMLSVEEVHKDVKGFTSSLEHHLVLYVLSYLDPVDLAKLEATSSIFRKPANYDPDHSLSLPELAARSTCEARGLIKRMQEDEKDKLKQSCGGSWKLVLEFLKAGESVRQHACPDVLAGARHSVVLTKSGRVYTFGANNAGQLGHPMQTELWKPQLLSSLSGVRVVQAAAGADRTMLVTDTGQLYAFGRNSLNEAESQTVASKDMFCPKLVESFCRISVVQVVLGHYFTAALSQQGKVYTMSWGSEDRLGHACDADREPHLLGGALTDIPVVQIAGGVCFLLALAYQASGMSIYSLGCGQGGKLGHGSSRIETQPCRIEYFDQHRDFKPIAVAAGPWHAVALSEDGRVCTWGWAHNGCLGHPDDEDCKDLPTIVTALADIDVKIIRIAPGYNATFAFADNGDAYCFGQTNQVEVEAGYEPTRMTALKGRGEDIVRLGMTTSSRIHGVTHEIHTLALTASGKVYASGSGASGQRGRQSSSRSATSSLVDIDFAFD